MWSIFRSLARYERSAKEIPDNLRPFLLLMATELLEKKNQGNDLWLFVCCCWNPNINAPLAYRLYSIHKVSSPYSLFPTSETLLVRQREGAWKNSTWWTTCVLFFFFHWSWDSFCEILSLSDRERVFKCCYHEVN